MRYFARRAMRYSGWLSAQSIAFRLVYRLLCSTGFLPHSFPVSPLFLPLTHSPSQAIAISVCLHCSAKVYLICVRRQRCWWLFRQGRRGLTDTPTIHAYKNNKYWFDDVRQERSEEGEEEEEGRERGLSTLLPSIFANAFNHFGCSLTWLHVCKKAVTQVRPKPPSCHCLLLPRSSATASTLCKKQSRNFCIFNEFIHCRKIRISKYTSSELTQEKLQSCQVWVNFAKAERVSVGSLFIFI